MFCNKEQIKDKMKNNLKPHAHKKKKPKLNQNKMKRRVIINVDNFEKMP